MNKQEIYQYLDENNIPYERTEHKAVFSMEELKAISILYPECEAKNLFVRDYKKQNYYLITVKGEKRVDLKAFRKLYGLRPLSFADARDLQSYLGLTPGAVTPFGLLNDTQHKVRFYLDADFSGQRIGVHPNDNAATVWLKVSDLVNLLREHGSIVEIAEL